MCSTFTEYFGVINVIFGYFMLLYTDYYRGVVELYFHAICLSVGKSSDCIDCLCFLILVGVI